MVAQWRTALNLNLHLNIGARNADTPHMSGLNQIEKKLISRGTSLVQRWLDTAVAAFADYKERHVGTAAASVSFYAIFSVFPLLAFMVYLIGKFTGDGGGSASLVLKILRDFVPAMGGWIEKGLFDIMRTTAVTSGVNACLLCWSALGLFAALLSAIAHLAPEGHGECEHRAHVTQAALAGATLAIFAGLMLSVAFCEIVGKTSRIPIWMQGLPFEIQDALHFGARTRLILGVVSVAAVAGLYKLLLPCPLRIRSALIGALLFTGLLLLSRSAYWIYLHYNKGAIQSTYGVFSTLILIMLWVHFIVSCLLYSCLFALHLDRLARAPAEAGHGPGPGAGHAAEHGAHGQSRHAA